MKNRLDSYYLIELTCAFCNTLLAPSCRATGKKHEGWDTARLDNTRQGKLRGRCRTTDHPVSRLTPWVSAKLLFYLNPNRTVFEKYTHLQINFGSSRT
ncbi:hypothetical protein T265_06389 [Opisthorchis viverrini]|uniref:Uncharacterized protein n=1 Tax=Opisthorchis viverrini TaxID=6198 RepID=A0A074ZGK7_OPIVI|nr:hypothetical protein T265_06389 [Opisthorchis viverrini]KER26343.1 hypothetical protein T265_06389 [Opisthorchis viverrini]